MYPAPSPTHCTNGEKIGVEVDSYAYSSLRSDHQGEIWQNKPWFHSFMQNLAPAGGVYS